MQFSLPTRGVTLVLLAAALLMFNTACGAAPTPTATPVPPTATQPPASTATSTIAPAPPTATQPPAGQATATQLPASQPTAAPATVPPPTATSAPTATQPPAATATVERAVQVSFAKDILPIFKNNCTRCHGGASPRSGMSLESYAQAMKGGLSAPDIVPGSPDKSLLYMYVRDGVMPFGGPPLATADIQKIMQWIQAGALNN